jgi:hypothetical protein
MHAASSFKVTSVTCVRVALVQALLKDIADASNKHTDNSGLLSGKWLHIITTYFLISILQLKLLVSYAGEKKN